MTSEAVRSDEALMSAYVSEGDQAAFKELFERYSQPLLRMMRRQIRSDEDARDMVQQTFLHLHRARHDFRVGSALRPWLFTIAMNLRREYFRRRARRPEVLLGEDGVGLEGRGEGIWGEVSPDALVLRQRQQTVAMVQRALGELPEQQREVIELHWLEELKFSEIAGIVGASLTAVKVRAHRGYERLRAALLGAKDQ